MRNGIPARGEVVDRHASRRSAWRATTGTQLAVGDATLTVGADHRAGSRDRRTDVRAGAQAAAQPRRRAGDESAAAGQSRDVAPAGCRAQAPARSSASARGSPVRRQPGQRVETVRDLRPEVRQTLERAERFLGLAALVAVLLAAVAVALAASRYLRRHLDAAAMLRCFGASVARTLSLFVVQFAALGIARERARRRRSRSSASNCSPRCCRARSSRRCRCRR